MENKAKSNDKKEIPESAEKINFEVKDWAQSLEKKNQGNYKDESRDYTKNF